MKRKLQNRVAGWANGHTNSAATNVVETAPSKLGRRVESCEMHFRVQGVVVFCPMLFHLTGENNNYSLCYSSFFTPYILLFLLFPTVFHPLFLRLPKGITRFLSFHLSEIALEFPHSIHFLPISKADRV